MDALIYPYDLPISTPLKRRRGILVQIGNGWGDIAPLPGWSKETLEEAEIQLQKVLRDEKLELYPSVAFGLESAIAGPLNYPAKVPLSALLMGSVKDILAKAERCEKDGFRSAKLKVSGLPIEEALDLVRALKKKFLLRIDVNRAWDLKTALRFFSHFNTDDFDYAEEPLNNPAELVHFTHPFALDESIHEDLLDLTWLKTLVIKPTLLGEKCRRFIELGKKRGLQIVFSSAFESGVGIYNIAALAVRSGVPLQPLGLDTYSFLQEDILKTSFDFFGGKWEIPEKVEPNVILSNSNCC